MVHLPNEILCEIFDGLVDDRPSSQCWAHPFKNDTLRDFSAVRLTCKAWNDVATRRFIKLFFHSRTIMIEEGCLERLVAVANHPFGQFVRDLTISTAQFRDDINITNFRNIIREDKEIPVSFAGHPSNFSRFDARGISKAWRTHKRYVEKQKSLRRNCKDVLLLSEALHSLDLSKLSVQHDFARWPCVPVRRFVTEVGITVGAPDDTDFGDFWVLDVFEVEELLAKPAQHVVDVVLASTKGLKEAGPKNLEFIAIHSQAFIPVPTRFTVEYVTRLSLSLAPILTAEEGLAHFIYTFFNLKDLQLELVNDDPELVAMSTVTLLSGTLQHLESFCLVSATVEAETIIEWILRHRGTLKTLKLIAIILEFYSWQDVFRVIHDHTQLDNFHSEHLHGMDDFCDPLPPCLRDYLIHKRVPDQKWEDYRREHSAIFGAMQTSYPEVTPQVLQRLEFESNMHYGEMEELLDDFMDDFTDSDAESSLISSIVDQSK